MFKLIFGILGEIFNAFSPLSYIVLGVIIIFGIILPIYYSIKESKWKTETDSQNREMERQFEEAKRPFRDLYYDKAKLEELKQKAQSGDPKSQALLATVYMWGANDKDLGMHWFRKAAENGDEGAIKILAMEQRKQQQQADIARMVNEEAARRQFVDDVNNLRKGRKLYY